MINFYLYNLINIFRSALERIFQKDSNKATDPMFEAPKDLVQIFDDFITTHLAKLYKQPGEAKTQTWGYFKLQTFVDSKLLNVYLLVDRFGEKIGASKSFVVLTFRLF